MDDGHRGSQEGISYLLRELGKRNQRIQQLENEKSQLRRRLELVQQRLARIKAKR